MLSGRTQPRLPVPDSNPAWRLRDVRLRNLACLQDKRRAGGGMAGQGRSLEWTRFRVSARGIGSNQSARVLRLGNSVRNVRICVCPYMDYWPNRIVNEA